jgi:hypothetical protein
MQWGWLIITFWAGSITGGLIFWALASRRREALETAISYLAGTLSAIEDTLPVIDSRYEVVLRLIAEGRRKAYAITGECAIMPLIEPAPGA